MLMQQFSSEAFQVPEYKEPAEVLLQHQPRLGIALKRQIKKTINITKMSNIYCTKQLPYYMLLSKRMFVTITCNSITKFLPGAGEQVFGENYIFEMQRLVFWPL